MRALLRALAPLLLVAACASREASPEVPADSGAAGAPGAGQGPGGAGAAQGGAGSAAGAASGGAGATSGGGAAQGGAGAAQGGAGGKAKVEATIRYLSLGDSFTIGTGSTPEQAFPARLVARWQGAGQGALLENPAVNGYTSQKILETQAPWLKSFKPTFVTLAAGANDIVQGRSDDDFRASIRAIVKAVGEAGVAPARLVAIPQPDWPASPVGAKFGSVDELRKRIARLNDILREEVQKSGGRYVDLAPLMAEQASKKMFAPDGLHPSAEAHDAWASALFEALSDLRP